jgi:hypothetical protein
MSGNELGRANTSTAGEDRVEFRVRKDCENCGSNRCTWLYNAPFDQGEIERFLLEYYKGRLKPACLSAGRYQIVRCFTCGFLWQRQVLTESFMKVLYEEWIDSDESLRKAELQSPANRSRLAHQVSLAICLLKLLPHEIAALDFGMGWGHWCTMALGFGLNVEGAELSQKRLAHAHTNGIRVISNLFDTNKKYDLINTEQVFEHVGNPLETLRMLTMHLTPKGLLRVSVPDSSRFLRDHTAGRWRPGKDAMHPLEHINGFEHTSLLRFGKAAGLRPIPFSRFLNAVFCEGFLFRSLNPRGIAEALFSQLRGTAIWFEHDLVIT